MGNQPPGALKLLGGPLFGFRRGIFRSAVTITAIALAGLTILLVVETALFPWARSFTGGPTLTGKWYGEFSAPTIGVQHAYVELDAYLATHCLPCRRLHGRARICDSRGQIRDFDVDGDINNWRGTSFWMSTGQIDNRDGLGVQFGLVEGTWEGDIITGTATLNTYNFAGGVSYSTSQLSRDGQVEEDPIVPLVLRRGTERDFEAACGTAESRSR